MQAIFIPHFAQVVYPDSRVVIDFDEQGHRLVSTVLEPNMAGAMIMLVLLVQLAQLAGGVRLSSWKPLLLFAALIATLSRSSMLGLIVGSVIILLARGISKRLLRSLVVIGAIALGAAPWLLRFAASYGKLGIDASARSPASPPGSGRSGFFLTIHCSASGSTRMRSCRRVMATFAWGTVRTR